MNKKEVERKLEEQHKQILLYEKRIKDLVNAYKSLDAEKNALQTVVETFEGSAASTTASSINEGASQETVEGLKQSLGILTREKLKREKAFQSDKKALLTENEALKQQLKKAADEAESQADKTANIIKALSEKVKQIEADRERELADHGSVLAEMQQRYAKEKIAAETAHKQLVEVYKKLQDKEGLPSQFKSKEKEYELQLTNLRLEIEEWRAKAARTPAIQLLQDQMTNLKADHAREIEELKKSGTYTNHSDRQSSFRINELEANIQNLTEIVAENERVRSEQLEQLKKLQDENRELKERVEASCIEKSKTTESSKLDDFHSLVQSLSSQGISIFDHIIDPRVAETKTRLEKVKDEFERYKLKAEAVLKAKDDDGLRTLVNQLHDKLRNLEVSHATDQAQYEMSSRYMRERISELEKSEEVCRNEMKQAMQKKISEMETEMQKQRNRTLDVLAEKERELEATKCILVSLRSEQLNSAPVDPPQAGKIHSKRRTSEVKRYLDRKISSGSRRSTDAISVSSVDYFNASGDANNLSFPNTNESKNIFYEDEIAKKEKDVFEMRNALHQLEYRMRDMEQSSLCKDLQHHEMSEKLKEEIRILESKLKLMSASDGNDIEYLRNIFVQYLSSSNLSTSKNILKAIGMVLKLSPNEMKAIDKR